MTSSIALTASAVLADAEPAAKRALKLTIIGDSITQGGGAHTPDKYNGVYEQSYRYPLWKNFVDAEWDVEMVGTVTAGFVNQPVYPDYKGKVFDRRNEGYWGWPLVNPNHTDDLDRKVQQNLKDKEFDMAILQGGGNDIGHFKKEDYADEAAFNAACAEAISDRVLKVVGTLRAINPAAPVFCVAQVATWEPQASITAATRKKIEALPADTPPVVFVELPGWVNNPDAPDTCTYDWIHTNARGDKMIADALFAAMKEHLEKFYAE